MDPLDFRLRNYAETEPASGKPFSSKALRDCYAQALTPSAGRGARSRRGRCAMPTGFSSAGGRHRDLPGPDVPGRGAGCAEGHRRSVGGDRRHRHGPGAPGPRSPRSPRRNSGFPSTRSTSASAPRTCRMAASPAARPTPPPPARRSRGAATDAIAPTRGARDAGFAFAPLRRRQCRGGRPRRPPGAPRRREPVRGLHRHPGPGGPRLGRGQGRGRARRGAREHYAMHAHGAVFAEVTVDPDLARSGRPASSAPSRPGGSSTRGWCAASITAG